MTLNLPYKARAAVYLLIALATPLVAYLRIKNIIGDQEVVLWGSYVTVGGTLATLNVTKPEQ